MEVADTTVTVVQALPPIVTALAPVRLVPVMVTEVPPAVLPPVGLMLPTVGAGTACVVMSEQDTEDLLLEASLAIKQMVYAVEAVNPVMANVLAVAAVMAALPAFPLATALPPLSWPASTCAPVGAVALGPGKTTQ
jgi:hypothetical protein